MHDQNLDQSNLIQSTEFWCKQKSHYNNSSEQDSAPGLASILSVIQCDLILLSILYT